MYIWANKNKIESNATLAFSDGQRQVVARISLLHDTIFLCFLFFYVFYVFFLWLVHNCLGNVARHFVTYASESRSRIVATYTNKHMHASVTKSACVNACVQYFPTSRSDPVGSSVEPDRKLIMFQCCQNELPR